jgi:hypothetical protein
MTRSECFKWVNDSYLKHQGGHMTTLELAQALNGTLCHENLDLKNPNGRTELTHLITKQQNRIS